MMEGFCVVKNNVHNPGFNLLHNKSSVIYPAVQVSDTTKLLS